MVRITPTYYANGVQNPAYILEGTGFSLIPDDAVGIAASSNDAPLQGINGTNPVNLYSLVERGEGYVRFEQQDPAAHAGYTYLGGIVSADRQTIYWENDTRPL